MRNLLKNFWRDEDGLETVEWAVIAAVIVGGAVAAFKLLGTNVGQQINNLANNVT